MTVVIFPHKKVLKIVKLARFAHLNEVDAQRVGFVLPADVDLRLRASTFALNLCAAWQSERRLLGDELQKHNELIKENPQ